MSAYKKYLGDGVYADFDGYQIVLTAENGMTAPERICLEPAVMKNLKEYEAGLRTS